MTQVTAQLGNGTLASSTCGDYLFPQWGHEASTLGLEAWG